MKTSKNNFIIIFLYIWKCMNKNFSAFRICKIHYVLPFNIGCLDIRIFNIRFKEKNLRVENYMILVVMSCSLR